MDSCLMLSLSNIMTSSLSIIIYMQSHTQANKTRLTDAFCAIGTMALCSRKQFVITCSVYIVNCPSTTCLSRSWARSMSGFHGGRERAATGLAACGNDADKAGTNQLAGGGDILV
jgi:hypothetical protein